VTEGNQPGGRHSQFGKARPNDQAGRCFLPGREGIYPLRKEASDSRTACAVSPAQALCLVAGESHCASHASLATNHLSQVPAFSNRHIPELEFVATQGKQSANNFLILTHLLVCIRFLFVVPCSANCTGAEAGPSASLGINESSLAVTMRGLALALHTSRPYHRRGDRLRFFLASLRPCLQISNRNIPKLEFGAKP